MSVITSTKTWFDMPMEIRDNILECLFHGERIAHKGPGARHQTESNLFSVLVVSKHFVRKRQVVDTMLRVATIALAFDEDLEDIALSTNTIQRSLVRSVKPIYVKPDQHMSEYIAPERIKFGNIKTLFPGVQRVEVDLTDEYYGRPELFVNRRSRLWQQLLGHEFHAHARREFDDPAITNCCARPSLPESLLPLCSLEEDFQSGCIELDRTSSMVCALLVRPITYEVPMGWRRNALGNLLVHAKSAGVEVLYSMRLYVESECYNCWFIGEVWQLDAHNDDGRLIEFDRVFFSTRKI